MFTLSNILKVNAISSGATGLLLVLFSEFCANLFGINGHAPFVWVGLFLIGFAIYVMYQALQKPVRPKRIVSIIWMDRLWVVASIIAAILLYPRISITGTILILAVAAWVGLMAYLQNAKLIRL